METRAKVPRSLIGTGGDALGYGGRIALPSPVMDPSGDAGHLGCSGLISLFHPVSHEYGIYMGL